jgi:hypothetical protein
VCNPDFVVRGLRKYLALAAALHTVFESNSSFRQDSGTAIKDRK